MKSPKVGKAIRLLTSSLLPDIYTKFTFDSNFVRKKHIPCKTKLKEFSPRFIVSTIVNKKLPQGDQTQITTFQKINLHIFLQFRRR